jgi:site-specific DNA-methyltransferase (adenine-specific)
MSIPRCAGGRGPVSSNRNGAVARDRAPGEAQPLPFSARPFFSGGGIAVLNDDFLATGQIPPDSVDLTVTSPPYNVDIAYGGYHDDLPYEEYLTFSEKWLAKCLSVTRPKGRLCLNVPLDKNKGGQQSVAADITEAAKRAGWRYHATIVWNEQNISRRTAWGSWMSPSAPFVIAPVEVILVLYKQEWARREEGRSADVTRDEFIDWTNAMWTFGGESATRIGHPAPFPVELPLRCIKLFSYVEDLILDPFVGSGSTLLACLRTGRKGIGIDVDEKYCALSVERLKRAGALQTRLAEE